MESQEISDVADTAAWVAAYRTMEDQRPDGLFRDPLAARLAGQRGMTFAREMTGSAQFAWSLAIRTRLIDEAIEQAISQGADAVLNLGAGLDTRPYRLSLPPALRWIEADQLNLVRFKDERLRGERPQCQLERVAVDLTEPAARDALFDRVNSASASVVVLTEGVVGYLTADDVGSLARALRARSHFHTWMLDYASPFLQRKMKQQRGVQRRLRNAPLRFEVADWEGFFGRHGWEFASMRYYVTEGARLNRPIPLPRLYRLIWPLTSTRFRDKVREMAGIALLTPTR